MSTLEYSLTIFTAETYPAVAGDGRNALLLGSTLSGKGYGVKIICLNPNGLLPERETVNGVDIHRLNYRYGSLPGRFLFRFSLFIHLMLNCHKKSKRIIYGAMPGYKTIVLASLFQKTPCFFRSTLWGFDDAESLAGKKSFFLSRLIFRNVNGYLALNSSFANSWQNIFGNFNIFQSFQGVDLKKYNITLKSENSLRLRKNLKIDESKFVILMVGHLVRRKGFPEIIDWLSRIDDDFLLLHVGTTEAPEWDLMGRHNDEMKILRRYTENKLGSKVRFMGRQANMAEFYLSADILLVASYAEGYPPNSVNEGLAAGLPVLTRQIAGVSDVITDGVNGYVFSDEKEFALKLSTLMNNPIGRMELSRNARIFAEEKLDIEKIVIGIQTFVGL